MICKVKWIKHSSFNKENLQKLSKILIIKNKLFFIHFATKFSSVTNQTKTSSFSCKIRKQTENN